MFINGGLLKILLKLSIACVVIALSLIIIFHDKNGREISIYQVPPEQIGLNIQSDYQVMDRPKIHIKWSWAKSLAAPANSNIQDIVAISWNDQKNWIGTSTLGEGGGGPGIFAVEQFKGDRGLFYIGQPLGIDSEVTFELIPVPPKANPTIPSAIKVYFIHPQRTFSGKWIDYTVEYAFGKK